MLSRFRFSLGAKAFSPPYVYSIVVVLTVVQLLLFTFWFLNEPSTAPTFVHRYLIPLYSLILSINFMVVVEIYLSNLFHSSLGVFKARLESNQPSEADDLSQLAARLIFGRVRHLLGATVMTFFGGITIWLLELDIDGLVLNRVIHGLILTTSGLAGLLISFAIGFWAFLYRFGQMRVRVDPFHPDERGGFKQIGDLAIRVVYILAIASVIYSTGYITGPYKRPELLRYLWWWVAVAVALVVFGIFIPALSLHRCLVRTKLEPMRAMSEVYTQLYREFHALCLDPDESAGGAKLEEISVKLKMVREFESRIDRMRVWPYESMYRRVFSTVAIPILGFVGQNAVTILKFFRP